MLQRREDEKKLQLYKDWLSKAKIFAAAALLIFLLHIRLYTFILLGIAAVIYLGVWIQCNRYSKKLLQTADKQSR